MNQSSIKNILVVNVNWLGDIIFSSPVFTNLRRQYPHARIVCLAVPRVKPVLECVPGVDAVLVYDEEGKDRGLFGALKTIFRIRREKFDAVFFIRSSTTRAWLCRLAEIPVRVGYDVKKQGRLLTHKYADPENTRHRSDRYLNVIEQFGVPVEDRTNVLAIRKDDKTFILDLFRKNGIVDGNFKIAVNLGGNWDLKQWPAGHFSLLIDRLMNELGAKVIIPGAEKDIELAQSVCAPLKNKPVILAGQTDLKQLMALMQTADLVISADSGPLHIANAVGTDVIGIFGPTAPEVTSPRGRGKVVILKTDIGCNRSSCYHLACPDNICMRAVSVDDVVNAVKTFKNSP